MAARHPLRCSVRPYTMQNMRANAALFLFALAAYGQTATPPAFEVASVKPAPLDPAKLIAGQQKIGATIDAARVELRSLTLADLIRTAYRLKSYQVSGPEWLNSERFDVIAKLPEGVLRAQIPEMLQTLLIERFKLATHRTTKDLPAFTLVLGKAGPKLKESIVEIRVDTQATRADTGLSARGVVTNSSPDGTVTQTTGPDGMRLQMQHMTMGVLVGHLSRLKDRPVTDLTGLTARYDFVLELSRQELVEAARASGQAMPPADPPTDGKSLENSLELLGLKLEARKLPVELLVIDRMEKTPTEN